MRVEDLSPELRSYAKKIPRLAFYNLWVLRFFRLMNRLGWFKSKALPGVTFEDVSLESAAIRVYRGSGTPSGVGLLWIHGGGMIAGTNKVDDKMCSRYVVELGAVVFSVEYRLAPEDPFPAGVDDCYEAWAWIVEHADALEIDKSKLIIAGQSGGGGLAASLAQRVKDHGGTQPAAQLLHCPMLDDRTGAKTELDSVQHIGWSNRNNRAAWTWYTGVNAGADTVPKDSVPARREDLTGLAPAWIGIGDVDLFYEESKSYADRLDSAGIEVIMEVVPDAPHGFEVFADETNLVSDYFARHYNSVRILLNANDC